MNKFKNNISGQASIIFIFLIFVIGLVMIQYHSSPSTTSPIDTQNLLQADACYQINDAVSVTYTGSTYVLLKDVTAIPQGELGVHMQDVGKIQTKDGEKEGFIAAEKNNIPHSVSWDSGAFNLLFIDDTDTVATVVPGYKYFSIYLKQNAPIPQFIIDYCNTNSPTSPRNVLPDATGGTIPPVSFNSADIVVTHPENTQPPANTIFYLYAYNGTSAQSFTCCQTNAAYQIGVLSISSGSIKKQYKVIYDKDSVLQSISLVDMDQNSPESTISYLYVTSSILSPYSNPTPSPTDTAVNAIQLRELTGITIFPWGWWSPECKPAIYLYPQEQTNIHVAVHPEGYFTYSNPLYPDGGWNVVGNPNGDVSYQGKNYPYLYYETAIRDSEITIPDSGYVVAYNKLEDWYNTILPQLGLTEKEKNDYIAYWKPHLPFSPYYFIGVMTENAINRIEPLSVSPLPDATIRIRLYYKPLDTAISVSKPILPVTPERKGFTLVEWGGIVKTDKTHPFSCSQ